MQTIKQVYGGNDPQRIANIDMFVDGVYCWAFTGKPAAENMGWSPQS
jgi:hypothetical protein